MLLKKLMGTLDIFLPAQLSVSVEAPLLYRARTIVGTNIVSLIASFALLAAVVALGLSNLIFWGVIFCILTLIFHLIFLKRLNNHFEKKLQVGATVQIVIITALIYLTAFSPKGMGFFGLIWLMPVFLMMAFYFNTRFSLIIAIINYIIYFTICTLKMENFHQPLQVVQNFPIVFYIFLSLVIAFTFFMAFLFVHLSEELQREVVKQRDLLVESAKFQSLGQMASNLAHDINNPLFTIQGKLHQMRNLLSRDQLDLERCDQIVESVEATLLKLSQIVKGISTFAREGRGDQMVSISVKDLIEGNLAVAIDRIKNSGIELEIHIDPKAKVICYPSFISQVLLNLLNNAIDALENSPVKKIEVKAYLEKNWIHISVCDSGAGVPKEIEAKIFEPFFTTKTFGKGTGLGLSISKGLIQVHEGELLYDRCENKTSFTVRLPSYE
jgi:signal transduction histidine kinase